LEKQAETRSDHVWRVETETGGSDRDKRRVSGQGNGIRMGLERERTRGEMRECVVREEEKTGREQGIWNLQAGVALGPIGDCRAPIA
jgi:hypothetical protein